MDNITHNQIVSFIWSIADDCLRDVYVRGKYRDVILPMVVIRRLDSVLEESKEEVLKAKEKYTEAGMLNQNDALCQVAQQSFCNSSPFRLKDLAGRGKIQQLKADFISYLDGFSPNVQEILDKFKFRNQIDTMIEGDILGSVIEKFISPLINLSPYPILDDVGGVRLPALDNHSMGVIFEELIRRFNEENNEEAGEHFTPRDVIELMADCVFMPIADKIKDSTYSCYDGASGTGGMLTVAQDRLLQLAEQQGKTVSIHLFGQEVNAETYAITKADMLLKGEGTEVDNIVFGSTLSVDGFPSRQFDFMLSNPPYGKSWKGDAEKMGGKKEILDTRFVTSFKEDATFSMIPRTSDGQLLFLLNNISKMKQDTELCSRIAEVHNGSALFTGDAGQGESNARRYMIENDLIEAIIALPENMFYNTGIGTFIWILSNKKDEKRRGKIQLIDATSLKSPLRKNLGKKNCEFTQEIRQQILDMYMNMAENEYSKVFDNSEFGYWKVTVLQPELDEDGQPIIDKKGIIKPNKELTDTEQIPFTYEGGIDAFIEKEVKPFAPYAWVDEKKTQIGYELSFTKYFYKPIKLRSLEEIVADIKALEQETDGLLTEIIGG
ncbi:type I restriction-modification system subunit M [Desulfovibrio litoralis]|uniref:site-specific DNA-methyltransferase (adenine-specific) n=1 Tax=Desulfovibrio litoralis DSM 11393 TaxID=1121455 RepID=A0A1M7SZJ0_9BACT|nr:class I SAM-dependent DNA methyltransferase [Desulfovibrio litoralis]SHN63872.1 type I restriction enzyme M protein [Desulfovibrio litoralis DSM 11393]